MAGRDYGALIRTRRNALGLNQAQLADRTGVSRNAVAGWETGHSRPDLNTVPALCEALEITPEAFFGTETPRTAEETGMLKLFRSLERRDREALLWQMEALCAGRKRQREAAAAQRIPEIRLPKYVTVYVSDLGAAAGFGTVLEEARGEETYLIADAETEAADEVITVSGRSMEPTFEDGDRVLVRHTDRLRPGEIGVFLVDNEGYIKEYQPDGLHSHNPEYGVMHFSDGQTVKCAGKVIGKLKPEQIPSREQMRMIEEAERAGKRGEGK